MNLFLSGRFVLHSGEEASFKIDCDALSEIDWASVALLLKRRLPPFGEVEGIPRGGLRLATHIKQYRSYGPLLLVDDVLTTGRSMEVARNGRLGVIGAVLFARRQPANWITPLFTMSQETS